MALSVGIVGLPNVGKSTVFNALTAGKAEAANYPFCTIDPNVGVVPVPDERLQRIEKHIKTQKIIPAIVEIVDIAGLVKGASQGEGLGNKFLANIRETNAILMMVRCFDDPNVIHVSGSVDPMRDIDVIDLELALADVETAEKRLKKAQGAAKTGSKEGKAELAIVEKVYNHLQAGKAARSLDLPDEEKKQIATWGLLTAKPVLYCCNVGEGDLPDGNQWSDLVKARAQKEAPASSSCAARSRPSSPSSRPRIAASCSRRTASRSPRSRRSPASATGCSACSRTSRPARRRSAPGRSRRAPPRPRRPA
jgi:GTP-binding protein YchF